MDRHRYIVALAAVSLGSLVFLCNAVALAQDQGPPEGIQLPLFECVLAEGARPPAGVRPVGCATVYATACGVVSLQVRLDRVQPGTTYDLLLVVNGERDRDARTQFASNQNGYAVGRLELRTPAIPAGAPYVDLQVIVRSTAKRNPTGYATEIARLPLDRPCQNAPQAPPGPPTAGPAPGPGPGGPPGGCPCQAAPQQGPPSGPPPGWQPDVWRPLPPLAGGRGQAGPPAAYGPPGEYGPPEPPQGGWRPDVWHPSLPPGYGASYGQPPCASGPYSVGPYGQPSCCLPQGYPGGGQYTYGAGPESRDLAAGSLQLVDSAGRARAAFQLDQYGNPQLVMWDGRGQPRLVMGLDTYGSPQIDLRDGASLARVGVAALPDGSLTLYVIGPRGEYRVALGTTSDGGTSLNLMDGGQHLRATIGLAPDGTPALMLIGPGGTARAVLALAPEGDPELALVGRCGKETIISPDKRRDDPIYRGAYRFMP